MPPINELLSGFLDTLAGHLALTAYLMAITDERAVWSRLKKIPPLLLSPLAATLLATGLYAVPKLELFQYFIVSFAILFMCAIWVWWAWQCGFWRAFASTCMAGIFQVAATALSGMLFWIVLPDGYSQFAMLIGLHLGISIAATLLLYKLRFGKWFRLLQDSEPAPWRTALLLFALEAVMEIFYYLLNGIQPRFLALYYLLMVVMAALIAMLVVHLAQRFDAAWKMRAQQDIIAQQQLYEQDLKVIRHEILNALERRILAENYDMKVVCSTANAQELLDAAQNSKQGIYFLDVELKDKKWDGFKLGCELRRHDPHGTLVYITSYGDLAWRTFRYHLEAFDYIVKEPGPIGPLVSQCLDEIHARLLAERPSPVDTLTLRTGGMVRHVPLDDILFFETASAPHHVFLHTSNSRINFLGSLNELETQLGSRFIRTHRAYLVAADKIEAVDLKHNKLWISGHECMLSRAGKARLRQNTGGIQIPSCLSVSLPSTATVHLTTLRSPAPAFPSVFS